MVLSVFLVDAPFSVAALFFEPLTNYVARGDVTLKFKIVSVFPFTVLLAALASPFIGVALNVAEKAERTDRFLAYLPPTCFQVLISRLLVSVATLLLTWAVPVLVFLAYGGDASGVPNALLTYQLCRSAVVGLFLFSIGWIVSLFVISAIVAMMETVLITIVVLFVVQRANGLSLHSDPGLLLILSACLATVAVGASIGIFMCVSRD
jgi:ABC-type transport system involved in multi-copper enzyme maturation permease subunit